jgi:hypothetical protein
MVMNAVITPHQPVCLYSAAGEEGEPPYRLHRLSGGPFEARNILIVSRLRAQGKCFSEKRSSTAKGLLLGVFFSAEGSQGKNTFDRKIQKLTKVIVSFGSTP